MGEQMGLREGWAALWEQRKEDTFLGWPKSEGQSGWR